MSKTAVYMSKYNQLLSAYQYCFNLIKEMSIKNILIGIFIVLFLLSIAVLKFIKISYASSLQFKGQLIKIDRGDHNIPQIHAPSFQSALYAWGYVTAEDRLFQLAFRRQSVRGQLSEHLGQKAIDIDKMFREINLYGWAVKSAQRFMKENATQYANFKAYAQGINDYYKSLTFKPLQFRLIGLEWYQWTVQDMFSLYKLIKWSLSFGMAQQYIRSSLLNKFTKQQVDTFLPYTVESWMKGNHSKLSSIVRDDEIPQHISEKSKNFDSSSFKPMKVQEMLEVGFFAYLDLNERASNSWVIGANLTDSGHALLCNDPHLDSALPGQWHQIKVFYPNHKGEEVYIIGAALTGLPTGIGKTPYVSFTMTTNYIDSQDLFKQEVKNDKYLFNGEWRPLKNRTQIIKVKNGQPISYKVFETHRGPLIKHIGSKGYIYKLEQTISLCWIGFTDAEYQSLVPYTRMAEVTEYSQVLDLLQKYTDYGPPFNLVYSTRDNHIGYYAIGLIPLRKHPHNGMYVKDGTNSDNDWIGFIQGKDKLHLQDPQRGYIVTANNKAAQKKYFNGVLDIGLYTARADRLEELVQEEIKAGKKLTKDFMRKMQLDTVDVYCLQLVEGMKKKMATGDLTYKFVFMVFQNFNCNFSSEATTPSFYLTFLQNLYQQLHPQGQNITFNLANFHSFHQHIYSFILKPKHTQAELLKLNNSMFDAIRQLRTTFDTALPSAYVYGQLHRDYMVHRPFSYSNVLKRFFEWEGVGFGNMNTPNVAWMNKFHQKDYRTNHRANLRLIMSYGEDSEWIIDGGTSQKFYSSFYRDQQDMFMKGKYIVMDRWNRTNVVY